MKYVHIPTRMIRDSGNPLFGRRIVSSCSAEILLSDEEDVADCKGLRRAPLVESLHSSVLKIRPRVKYVRTAIPLSQIYIYIFIVTRPL